MPGPAPRPHLRRFAAARTPPGPSPVVRGAALAAAAALGVLVGLGLHAAASWTTALARLTVVGYRLRGLPEFVTADHGLDPAFVVGAVQVAVIAAGWGTVVAAIAARVTDQRTPRSLQFLIGIGTALGVAGADALLPTPLRLAAGTLTPAEWGLAVAVTALAGWIGATRIPGPPPLSTVAGDIGTPAARDDRGR